MAAFKKKEKEGAFTCNRQHVSSFAGRKMANGDASGGR